MDKDQNEMDNENLGPMETAAVGCDSLARAIEHARSLAGAQAAGPGMLGPPGAEIWLRFCRNAGLDGGEPQN